MRTRQLNFRVTIPTLDRENPVRYAPVSGTIDTVVLHFPAGVQGLVEVFIYHGEEQILPEGRTGIALDGATQVFDIHEPIRQDEPIQVTFINHDDSYEHTISCILSLKQQPKEREEHKNAWTST